MGALLIALLAVANPAEAALDAAAVCYAELDYGCAETRLAEALAGDLSNERRVQAHLYEALLSMAYRDQGRARRSVRALFAIDPTYQPGPLPPQLKKLFDAERPPPPPPPRLIGRLDFTRAQLFGQDAGQWSEGLGVDLGVGVLLDDRFALELTGAYTNHAPRVFTLNGLDLWRAGVAFGYRWRLGPVRVQPQLGLGLGWISIDGALADDSYSGIVVEPAIEVSWPIWKGLGLGARLAPLLIVTQSGDQAAGSYILPVTIGLRYGE